MKRKEAKLETIELLRKVGIPDPEKRYKDIPGRYSGGMRQRVVIAIALASKPKILICDEPTTALDVTIQAQILDLIKELQEEYKFTVIFITHDLGVVAKLADRIAVMYAGQIVEIEELEYLEEFVQFLEMSSIDEIVKKSYLFKNQNYKKRKQIRKNVQMIFQDPGSSLNDRMAVEEIISEGLENFPELFKSKEIRNEYLEYINKKNPDNQITINKVKNKDVKKYLVLNAIQSVGLMPEHLSRYPHEFSGGQRQRIGIARSLIMKPKVIVADEPISALDVSIRAQVLNLFKKFKEELDRIAVIYRGQIVELADANDLFNEPLHPYTKSLLSAIPIPEPELAKKEINIIYNPEKEHFDYMFDLPSFKEVKPNHFVYLNKREINNIK
ncbi:hypothetical protein FQR65_LT15347 [Abscondita terminalis]|nr:hypothetical protein FQR65_LT15347 [Abscondita terminalis]